MVDLKIALNNLLSNAYGHPRGDKFRSVYAVDLNVLREYYKENFEKPVCQRCGNDLNKEGYCRDETCPYSDFGQEVPNDMFLTEETTLDIFDACASDGIKIKIRDGDRLADNDLFECEDCGYAFDIEDSVQKNTHYYCPSCAANHPSK